MQGNLKIRRIGGPIVAAAALAVAVASPASAMIGPACDARLVPAATGPSASCSFDSPTDWATIQIEPVGTVTATVRCFTSWGSTITKSRTVSATTTWTTSTPGSCSLTLTADASTIVANASATPALRPIFDPGPPV
ncbi:MAG TPA: hypothetical protein VGW75_09320 [Solirubrobacteraceae bacterium]|jgi:hypothetical protein|nr:hypothetical protein [Solirubrobacteraceae bacterium]